MAQDDKPLTPQERTGIGRPPKLTWEVFQAICARVQQTGVKYASCAEFGLGGSWVVQRIKELAEQGQPEWLELWEQSLELFADRLEQEMARRAIEGVSKPVFYKGKKVGTVQEYSDQLAITLAKAVRPERFRDNVKVDADISGGVLLVPGKMSVEEFLAQNRDGPKAAPDTSSK